MLKQTLPVHSLFLRIAFILAIVGFPTAKSVYAYSDVTDRPIFLAWPLPTYIGLARISQFPNTPWTWNYLGLNPEQQCPPAFGYVLDPGFWPVWRDMSIPEKQDMAKADPHNFEMVNCYSTLGEAGKNGHEGTDIKAPAKTPALASADGKVAGWRLSDVNSLIVLKHCLGGQWDASGNCMGGTKWYTTYMHIIPNQELFQMEKDVSEGMQVGTIYNQGDNSHLHFEVGLSKRSYMNYINPWGKDQYPWYGCMWKDQSLCVQSNPGYMRIAFLTQSDRFLIRDDAFHTIEVFKEVEIKQIQMAGVRIAVVDEKGNLLVKDVKTRGRQPFDYEFLANWLKLGNEYISFQITSNQVGVLEENGIFKLKVGDLNSQWIVQSNNTHSFSISDHRVGFLTHDGHLIIKEGNPEMDGLSVASNVKAFQLLDTRVAVLDLQGNLFVQEGALTNEWKMLGTNVRAFQLSGTRIAMLDQQGNLLVNDGNLRAEFLLQASGVQQFQLAGNRIVVLDKDGKWKIKVGDLYQTWKEPIGIPIKTIQLNGEMPIMPK